MNKFGRNYELYAQASDGETKVIKYPFTLEFDVKRSLFGSPNISSFRIYNLSTLNRAALRKDVNNNLGSIAEDSRGIYLRAGYGETMPIIFKGTISQAWSVREGVDWITEIQSFDGGFAYANGSLDENFKQQTTNRTIIESMVNSLKKYGVEAGAIGDYEGEIARGNAYSGSTTEILRELTGGGFFIDNAKAHCLKQNEVLAVNNLVINASSGLLGTPLRETTNVHIDILFEPRVVAGQAVLLESFGDVTFNGLYKVMSIHHKGVISEAVSGSATTSLVLLRGKEFDRVRE